MPSVTPPEAQGNREAWPEAALVCTCQSRCCPTLPTGDGRTQAADAVFRWPSPPAGQLRKPQATSPHAIGPNGSGLALTAALPACVPASPNALGQPGRSRAPGLCHAALDIFPLTSGTIATVCRGSASPTTSTSRPVTCARCFPPQLAHAPIAAAHVLSGAPDGAAAALPACRPSGQGWLDGPGHRDVSLGGRGFAPTPNLEPTPLGGVSCNGKM